MDRTTDGRRQLPDPGKENASPAQAYGACLDRSMQLHPPLIDSEVKERIFRRQLELYEKC